MTYRRLYREVAKELHPDWTEEQFQYGDSVSPSGLDLEVPPEMVEPMRKMFLEQARDIDNLPIDEARKELKNHLSKN